MNQSITESIRSGKVSALQILVIASCVFMNAIDGVDVLAISFTAPLISSEWEISALELGIVFSAGLFGMAAGALLLGPLGDFFGRKPAALVNLALMTVGMVASAFVSSIPQLMLARVVTGLGIGGILPSINTLVMEFSPEKYKNFSLSLMHVGYPVGAVISGSVAAFLISEYGWRSVFIAGGLLSAGMMIVVVIWLPESIDYLLVRRPKNALGSVNAILKRMRRPLLQALPPSPAPIAGQKDKHAFAEVFSPSYRLPTLLLWACFFFVFMTLYFLLNWIPTIMVDSGFNLAQGISVGVLFNVGGIIGMPLFGYVSAITGLRLLTRVYLVLGAVGIFIFALSGLNLSALYVATLITGFFVLGDISGLYSSSARLYTAKTRNTGHGLAIGVGRFGAILGPILGGMLIEYRLSTPSILLIFAAPLVLSALFFIFIKYEDPKTVRLAWLQRGN